MTRARRPSPQTATVLDALAEIAPGWTHGYDLGRALGLKAGTLYPILIRLAERGHLEAAWETEPAPGRPPRHLYRLSPAGLAYVASLTESRQAADEPRVAQPAPRPAGAEA